MSKLPGPLCTWDLGNDWIDGQTLDRTQSHAPAHRHAPPPRTAHKKPNQHHKHHSGPSDRNTYTGVETALLAALNRDGVTDPTEQAMFLAQLSHESSDFTRLRENLNYSSANLMKTFPAKFKNEAEAKALAAKGPDAIAEFLYGHREKLGNTQDGDGAKYRGRGYIQLTGRSNYAAAGKYLKLDLLAHPELAELPENAARIAVWFWKTRPGLRAAGAHGDVKAATKIINGGYIGLADRRARFIFYLHLGQQASQNASVPILP